MKRTDSNIYFCCCTIKKKGHKVPYQMLPTLALTFGDSIALDGVFLPEMTFSFVELELSTVFWRLGAWVLDWVALPGPPVAHGGEIEQWVTMLHQYIIHQHLFHTCA